MTAKSEKPEGAKAGWKLGGSETRFENDIFRLREDEVELAGGKKIRFAYLERDPAVIVVPVTDDGQIIMVKHYRYAVDDWCLEVPAGGTHDAGDTPLEEVARKELREEVGATARSITRVTSFYSANAMSDEEVHVFFADGVELSKKQDTEASETIETQLMPVEEALAMARNGTIKTGPCALAILLCEPFLKDSDQHRATPDHMLET